MTRRLLISIVCAVLFLVSVTAFAGYMENEIFEGDDPKMPDSMVIDGDYYASGEEVEILGTVNGDLYVSGGEILVKGKINGDVLAAGGRVRIDGQVTDDVRVAGGEVIVSGLIGKNVTVAGGMVTLARSGEIGGSALLFAGDVEVAAIIGRDLKVVAENVVISGTVDGDVEVVSSNVELIREAEIKGDLSYMSANEALIDRQARVLGKTNYVPMSVGVEASDSWGYLVSMVVKLLAILVVGLLFAWLFPNFARQSITFLEKTPFKAFLWGLITVVVVPFVVVFLLISMIGLPLGLMMGVGYLIMLYVAKIFVALWLGNSILEKIKKPGNLFWSLSLGLLIYSVVVRLPKIGGLVAVGVTVLGVGMIVIGKKELIMKLRQKNLV